MDCDESTLSAGCLKTMTQHQAVERVMQENGGYATLGYLYQAALKVPGCNWGTKTPFASIRKIVQINPKFFKIKLGLWGLSEARESILKQFSIDKNASPKEKEEFGHSYYQGLVVEIGNLKNYETFVPSQDRNRPFLSKKLSDIATLKQFYDFTYDNLVNRAKTIDVTWFNERHLPCAFFEIEHSTDIQNSLLKFIDLQDFQAKFRIVADASRRREFERKILYVAFRPISSVVQFMDYESLSEFHSKISESVALERRLML